jgi:hypothetical protein
MAGHSARDADTEGGFMNAALHGALVQVMTMLVSRGGIAIGAGRREGELPEPLE